MAFIPNPENKPQVNHIDENINNNYVPNLNWMTSLENNNHGTKSERLSLKNSKKVKQYDLNGNYIKTFNSAFEIKKELNICKNHIRECCNGKALTASNFVWRYENDSFEKYRTLKKNIYLGKIKKFDKTGNLIKIYNNREEVKEDLKTKNIETIIQVCSKRKKSYLGFIWRYEHDNFEI